MSLLGLSPFESYIKNDTGGPAFGVFFHFKLVAGHGLDLVFLIMPGGVESKPGGRDPKLRAGQFFKVPVL